MISINDQELDVDKEEDEICVAKLQHVPPYTSQMLKLDEKQKFRISKYSFDVTKVDKIFDVLLKDKQIALSDDHKISSVQQRKRKGYCKFHYVFGHWINSCLRFRDMVQKAIDKGRLKFKEKPMKVDTNPFHIQANYIEPMQIMMMGALIGTPKMSTPLSKEEVDQALEDSKKEEELIFPLVGESLVKFLLKKQKV